MLRSESWKSTVECGYSLTETWGVRRGFSDLSKQRLELGFLARPSQQDCKAQTHNFRQNKLPHFPNFCLSSPFGNNKGMVWGSLLT